MPDEMREWIKQAARAQAWDTGQDCPTCGGSGKIPNGRRVIHSLLGGFGADWNVDQVLAAIDDADEVAFGAGIIGHQLMVRRGDDVLFFEVNRPEGDEPQAAGDPATQPRG